MSATGTMQIILGLIALNYRVISDRLFTALVFTAVATSLAAAPLIRLFLKSDRKMSLLDLINGKLYAPGLEAVTPEGAITELAGRAAKRAGLPGGPHRREGDGEGKTDEHRDRR